MRSASTRAVTSASELSKVAQEKAIQGQPTLAARIQAQPVQTQAPQAPQEHRAPEFPRVMARPILGQAPAAPAVAAVPGAVISRDEAKLILSGLTETLRLADDARNTGWRCTGVDDATFYKGRVLRDRLAAYMASPGNAGFQITKDEADVAEKILGCSNEATASSPNKTAWIVLGVIVAGAAVFFSLTSRSR